MMLKIAKIEFESIHALWYITFLHIFEQSLT